MKALRASILSIMLVACLFSCDQNDSDEIFENVEVVTRNTEEEDHPKKEGTTNSSNSTEEEDHPKKE